MWQLHVLREEMYSLLNGITVAHNKFDILFICKLSVTYVSLSTVYTTTPNNAFVRLQTPLSTSYIRMSMLLIFKWTSTSEGQVQKMTRSTKTTKAKIL